MPADLLLPMILFILVGLIVSMDVSGLTLSRAEDLKNNQLSVPWWSFYHAFWHTVLLAAYLIVIHAGLELSPEIKQVLLEFVDFLRVNLQLEDEYARCLVLLVEAVQRHLNLLLGLIALLIVWRTYSDKIADDPTEAKTSKLPPLAQFVFNAIELVKRTFSRKQIDPMALQSWLVTQAQAALVAVDMLALAILLKALGLINDARAVALVLVVIFVTVFACSHTMARYSVSAYRQLATTRRRYRERTITWIRVTLRLAEPFLIFFFALQLVVLLLVGSTESGSSLFAGAFLLLIALVKQHGLTEIVRLASLTKLSPTAQVHPLRIVRPAPQIVWEMVRSLIIGLLVILIIVLCLFLFAAFIRVRPGELPGSTLALDTEIAKFIAAFSGLAAAAKFFHTPLLYRLERVASFVSQWITRNRRTIFFMLAALIVVILFPLYDSLVDDAIKKQTLPPLAELFAGLRKTHEHALQVVLTCVTLLGVGYLFEWAETHHAKRLLKKRLTKKQVSALYWEWQHAIVWGLATALILWIGKLQGMIGF